MSDGTADEDSTPSGKDSVLAEEDSAWAGKDSILAKEDPVREEIDTTVTPESERTEQLLSLLIERKVLLDYDLTFPIEKQRKTNDDVIHVDVINNIDKDNSHVAINDIDKYLDNNGQQQRKG